MVVPGAVLDREACAAAMDDEPRLGRDRTITDVANHVGLTAGQRDADLPLALAPAARSLYAAVMSSVYARRDGAWRLVLHQQTPDPQP